MSNEERKKLFEERLDNLPYVDEESSSDADFMDTETPSECATNNKGTKQENVLPVPSFPKITQADNGNSSVKMKDQIAEIKDFPARFHPSKSFSVMSNPAVDYGLNQVSVFVDDPRAPLLTQNARLRRQSLIRKLRRASLAGGMVAKAEEEDFLAGPDSRRSSMKTLTGYGTLYTPLLHRLSILHRMSFADVVERITLTWDKINVFAPYKPPGKSSLLKSKKKDAEATDANLQPALKQILCNVTGLVEPGTLLAIMGASGSGKTTLLNVLTYRNRGSLIVQGDVRVNGGQIGKAMPSLSAYVQQEDLFLPTITVKEHLWFQSQLRMDREIPKEIREDRVDEVMQEMGLHKCSEVLIGAPGKIKGISGGEKKRLAFASELLTNPPLLFLDEPTSGLDSYMAHNILTTLKQLASQGRSVVCTIHQPSSELFELFDRLLLLSEGKVAYIGPANEASEFFKGCGYPTPPNYNPADHFVRSLAIEPGREEESKEKTEKICKRFEMTKQADYVRRLIEETNFCEDGALYDEEVFSELSPYKASWFRQFFVVFWRCFVNNLREPAVFKIRLLQIVVLSLIFSLVYWQQELNQRGVSNINGALFLMQMQMTIGFIFNVVLIFPSEFPVFLREHFDGVYRADVYFLCKTLVELPQFTLLPLIFTVMMYWSVGFYNTASAFFICFACNFMVCNTSVSFGYLLSTALNNTALALAVGPLFLTPCIMIGGFFVNSASIPIYFVWLKYLSWFTYANEILVVNQWSNIDKIECVSDSGGEEEVTGGRCFDNGKEVIASLGYKEGNMLFDFMMLLVLALSFRLISFMFLLARARKTYKIDKKKFA